MSELEVKLHIFKLLRPTLRAPDITYKLKHYQPDELSEDELLKLEYDHFFEDEDEPIYKR